MADPLRITNYINKYFNHFEPALKEKLIENCSIQEFNAGDVMMQTGQYFRSTTVIEENGAAGKS